MKQICSIIAGLTFAYASLACDVCGGVNSGPNMGLLPAARYHFIGLRSGFRHYESTMENLFTGEKTYTTERFASMELIGRLQFHPRWNAGLLLPYQSNWQVGDTFTTRMNGLGDLSLSMNYLPIVKTDSMGNMLHALSCGVVLKFPTGKHATFAHEMSNQYPGTGAYDLGLLVTESLQLKKWNLMNEGNFIIRTAAKNGYQYGNVLSISSVISRSMKFRIRRIEKTESFSWKPFIGLQFLFMFPDQLDHEIHTDSQNNGAVLGLRMGATVQRKNWLFTANVQAPIYQALGIGAIQQKEQAQLSVLYLLNTKKK
jgi:hypothetical protein